MAFPRPSVPRQNGSVGLAFRQRRKDKQLDILFIKLAFPHLSADVSAEGRQGRLVAESIPT